MTALDQSIVISLRSSVDRLATFLPAWDAEGVDPLVFDGITWPHSVPRPHLYAKGAVGCSLSQLAAIRVAKMLGWNTLLLLEDDARPEPGFTERLEAVVAELPDDWRILFVGNAGGRAPSKKLPAIIPAKTAKPCGAIAMLFNIEKIDDILTDLDSLRAPTTALYQAVAGAYALRDPLAWHAGGVSTITGRSVPNLRTPSASPVCDTCGSIDYYPRYDLPGVPNLCPACYLEHLPADDDVSEEDIE